MVNRSTIRQHAVVVSSMVGNLKEARSPDWSKLFTRGLKWGTAEGTSCARNWVPRSGVGERASGGFLQQSGPSSDFHSDPLQPYYGVQLYGYRVGTTRVDCCICIL